MGHLIIIVLAVIGAFIVGRLLIQLLAGIVFMLKQK
jgi:hypothetical protein